MKTIKVVKKTKIEKSTVYDLSIKDNTNYQVGKSGAIVHNSGKGFILDNLLGIEGNVFDVDALKSLAIQSVELAKLVKDQTGVDIKTMSLKDPKQVYTLHTILADKLGIIDKRNDAKFKSILTAPADRKPNLIFDVTLKNMKKLYEITDQVKELGYEPENIHIVWVVNDYEIAKQQNRERSRQVPEEILMDTHRGAAQTAKDILDMGHDITKYMNGDIWYAFNKRGVDSKISKSDLGGSFISDANYIKVKDSGKPIDKNKVTKEVVSKIASYVPPSNYWN